MKISEFVFCRNTIQLKRNGQRHPAKIIIHLTTKAIDRQILTIKIIMPKQKRSKITKMRTMKLSYLKIRVKILMRKVWICNQMRIDSSKTYKRITDSKANARRQLFLR
jgi:hypothetical protein